MKNEQTFAWNPICYNGETDEWEGAMPQDEGEVLITTNTGVVVVDEVIIDTRESCNYYFFDTWQYDVIAWAPIPEPYVQES